MPCSGEAMPCLVVTRTDTPFEGSLELVLAEVKGYPDY